MNDRCACVHHPRYYRYGGRGIRVLYSSFEEFVADVGLRPSSGHSIDRIDSDDHYRPGNCRWATQFEQQRNRTNNALTADIVRAARELVAAGETITAVARQYGVIPQTLGLAVNRKTWADI